MPCPDAEPLLRTMLAAEDHWSGPIGGQVVTRQGHAVPCRQIEIVEASHPVPVPVSVPDQAGEAAAARMSPLLSGLSPDDLVLDVQETPTQLDWYVLTRRDTPLAAIQRLLREPVLARGEQGAACKLGGSAPG